MIACPDPETLSQMLTGESSVEIGRHLEDCPSCRRRFDELTAIPWSSSLSSASDGDTPRPGFLADLAKAVSTVALQSDRSAFPDIPGFEILGEIGRGGMGVVYKALQTSLNRVVALKVLAQGGQASAKDLARFHAEAQVAAQLHHPNIVAIHEIGEWRPNGGPTTLPYISLEYVDGKNLAKAWQSQPQAPDEVAELIGTLAKAMHIAHGRGLIHRDLKPANILLSAARGAVPKIADFGLAFRFDADVHLTRTGDVVGTPSYMAPEQARGRREAFGPTVDIYALGAVLYEGLVGRPPFKAASTTETLLQVAHDEPIPVRQLNPAVPKDLATICMTCLNREPHRRYASAELLADDLRRFLKHEPILARPVSLRERVLKWVSRNRAVSSLMALQFVMTIVVLLLWWEAATRTALEKEARAREQTTNYFDKIRAADAAFRDGNVREATALLDGCPKEMRGWEWHYLNRLCRGAPVVCERRVSDRGHVSFRPDGLQVASTDASGLWLHDARTGKTVRGLKVDHGGRLSWEPTGRWLAMARNHEVWLIDPLNLTVRSKFTFLTSSIACSPDGRVLALGSDKGSLVLWNTLAEKTRHVLAAHTAQINQLAFHPNGVLLASGSKDMSVAIWDITRGTQVTELMHDQPVWSVAWSRCGKYVVSASHPSEPRSGRDTTILVWSTETWTAQDPIRYVGSFVGDLAFSPDGTQLAGATARGLQRWNWPNMQELPPIRGAYGVCSLSYSGDGSRLVTSDEVGAIKIWDSNQGQEPFNARPSSERPVFAMAAHPSKPLAACGDGQGNVEIVDVTNGKLIQRWRDERAGFALSLAWDPQGSLVAVGCQKAIMICRLGDADCLVRPTDQRIYGIAFLPDGSRFVTGGEDKTVRVWDTATGAEVDRLAELNDRVRALAVGKTAVAADCAGPGAIHLWDLESRQLLHKLEATPKVASSSLAFSPDGAWLAAGGHHQDSAIRIWDVAGGKEMGQCRGHKTKVTSVTWSPDGKRLVSASDDATVTVWEPKSGRMLLTLRAHTGATHGAAFTADGRFLVTTGWDGKVLVWDATPLDRP